MCLLIISINIIYYKFEDITRFFYISEKFWGNFRTDNKGTDLRKCGREGKKGEKGGSIR